MGMIDRLNLLFDLSIGIWQVGNLTLVVITAARHVSALGQIDEAVVLAKRGDYLGFGFVVASRA
jgi:hypothetical protein